MEMLCMLLKLKEEFAYYTREESRANYSRKMMYL